MTIQLKRAFQDVNNYYIKSSVKLVNFHRNHNNKRNS